MPRYDLELVKAAASGRWPEIISRLDSVDISLLDGKPHLCPKCGGTDRFHFDREGRGGVFCNHCQPGTGDGFGTLRWLTGWDFPRTLDEVAKFVGVQPVVGKKEIDPAGQLEFIPWNSTIVGLWCLKKKPIVAAAVEAIGGRVARYQKQYTVIAIPVWGPSLRGCDAVGWVLYRADGGLLPKGKKDNPEWVKVKLTAGSGQGIIGDPKWIAGTGQRVWKTEGPTDLLALLSLAPDAAAFTTANGAQEKPLNWIVNACEGKSVAVVHDADEAGQLGSTWVTKADGTKRAGWCPRLAEKASHVVNVVLPVAAEQKDLRDRIAGGATIENLNELADVGQVFAKPEIPLAVEIDEAIDDPHRLARVNLERYRSEHDGRLVYWRDEWWKWKDGRYRKIENSELRAKVWAAIRIEYEHEWRHRTGKDVEKPVRKITRSLVANVVGAMESICAIASSIPMPCWMPDRSFPHYVSTINGILDLGAVFAGSDEVLLPHSPEWLSAFRLDYPFDAAANCPLWMSYLDYCLEGDAERIALLQEWSGYLLTNENDYQKFLVLEGEGSNGKTVYFAAMTAMLGEDNVSHVSIENFDGRFELGTTIGKAANISGDAGEIDQIAEGVLKQFTGGDTMQFDRKNLTPISARPTAKLMAAWNSRPHVRDKSMGLWRRMILVPFNRSIPDELRVRGMDKPRWWIEKKEIAGILLWAIAGLDRLREQCDFTRSQVAIDAATEYREESNPVQEFFVDYLEPAEGQSIECSRLYEFYLMWCRKNGRKPLGSSQFGKEIKRKIKIVERKRIRDGKSLSWNYCGIKFSVSEIFSESTDLF